jgi:hypothetical protein
MIDIWEQMMFYLVIESTWNQKGELVLYIVVSSGDYLMFVPVFFNGHAFSVDMSDLTVYHKTKRKYHSTNIH